MSHAATLTPVVIGVGDIKNTSVKPEYAYEPIELMIQAITAAANDSSVPRGKIIPAVDSIDVVANWTWPYPNAAQLLAEKLGVKPVHQYESGHGGNAPAKLFDEAARRVSKGECRLAVVTGGEALASLAASMAEENSPPSNWTEVKDHSSIWERSKRDDLGTLHSIGLPIQVYPLYEAGLRAHRKQTYDDNHQESAQLYANFAEIAATNPVAWNYGRAPATIDSIATITKKNRMICSPYPLLMNAFNNVNMAAACIVTSVDFARQLGVPESRWIYPLGGAGTSDASSFWERHNFHSSPSIANSLDEALRVSGLTKEDIDIYDFYSCFPIVPKLACRHLDLPITRKDRPLTVLGGLTSFGGAGNNYSLHAITQVVRELRARRGQHGLVLANGGVLSYHHVVCLSVRPRADRSLYPCENPLPEFSPDISSPPIAAKANGRAVIETYTVDFQRNGSPGQGYVVGRLESGQRFIANAANAATLKQLSSTAVEQIGRTGWVLNDAESSRNLFSFEGPHI
ncbi:hypothetical protein BDV37DRAFT_291351 [Aspergillus pseudonomiae]|uniref:Thiolase-like protein type 1 additional C-terminal domain-containing protein n=1 Tax=Aspergillus pseudonomiae TaxID=1506151 RepID=A0A5N7DM78_9EURO|nr:uncharacterized protein BDV37DRAFT_291351 [Aspergillus pseudonomiae]KAE8407113.1 hypothetical protein BDV37DRAFT_291351 [Aspergillus pseudonomiae]